MRGRAERTSVKPEALHYLETLLVDVIGAALAAQNAPGFELR
jgi:2-methylcitrate dehydratase PrpD